MSDERPHVNPFSAMAVARISSSADDEPSIETDPIRVAKVLLDDYLNAARQDTEGQPGNVIAIVGDYGTGKTHLAMELIRHAQRAPGYVRSMYLDATASNFASLYRRFIDKLSVDDIRARINEYYAEIVVDSLKGSGTDVMARQLLLESELEPGDVVDRFSLSKTDLLRRLQDKLKSIADDDSFVTALMLLLRRGFGNAVWNWLRGAEPEQILVERDITLAISTDAMALEVMGYLAQLLYGGRRMRFVLVIDELDKVLSAQNKPQDETMGAFRTLLQVFETAGAFLVLSGLPDFNLALREDVRQRITRRIFMSGLDSDQVCRFVERAQLQSNGSTRLEPFTPDSISYLVQLANGKPRTVIRLCHRLYQLWMAEGVAFTDELVREVARDQLGLVTTDDVSAEARRLLDANDWSYLRQHFLASSKDTRVDYWVTFEADGPGCAVLITDSVLDTRDVQILIRKALAVRASKPDCRIMIVVNGMLAAELGPPLREVTDCEPLVYERLFFADHLGALLRMFATQLRVESQADPVIVVRDRVEQIGRHQLSIYDFIEKVASRLDSARSSADRQFGVINERLEQLTRIAHLGAAGGVSAGGVMTPVGLPSEVEALFTSVVDVLENLLRLYALIERQFESGPASADIDPGPVAVLRYLQRLLEPTAIAVALHKTISSFWRATADWYHSDVVEAEGNHVTVDAMMRLEQLCGKYDEVCEHIQLTKLEPLVAEVAGSDPFPSFYSLGARVLRSMQRALAVD
jgi:Cdc6-like AAA superfamily ATPase